MMIAIYEESNETEKGVLLSTWKDLNSSESKDKKEVKVV